MIKKKMEEALNKQINEEMFSFYLYLAMSADFESKSLMGFSHWMKTQAQEELLHALKFYNHILERGGHVELQAIAQPKKQWSSPLNAFEEALAHEEHITTCINDLMTVAIEEKDHAAQNLLKWFVDEQVEEEANATEIVDKLRMIGDHGPMLLMQDKELGARPQGPNPFFPPAAAAE
jgi:ferritin